MQLNAKYGNEHPVGLGGVFVIRDSEVKAVWRLDLSQTMRRGKSQSLERPCQLSQPCPETSWLVAQWTSCDRIEKALMIKHMPPIHYST